MQTKAAAEERREEIERDRYEREREREGEREREREREREGDRGISFKRRYTHNRSTTKTERHVTTEAKE